MKANHHPYKAADGIGGILTPVLRYSEEPDVFGDKYPAGRRTQQPAWYKRMEILDYQAAPPKRRIDLRAGAWQVPLSCFLSLASLPIQIAATEIFARQIMYDQYRDHSYSNYVRHAYLLGCIPAGLILAVAFSATFLSMPRRRRLRPGTLVALVFNLATTAFIVMGFPP